MLNVVDTQGVRRRAALVFTWRWLSPRFVHETIIEWFGEGDALFCPDTHTPLEVQNPRTAVDRRRGGPRWRDPRPGGHATLHTGETYLTVFCDDLFFCPLCGRFWMGAAGEPKLLPPDASDASALALFETRKRVPEFAISPCKGSACAANARVVERLMLAGGRE